MQFGVHLPSFWNDYGTSNVRTAVEETARAADALGFASVWANDSVLLPPDLPFAGHRAGVIDPLVTLASLIHLVPRSCCHSATRSSWPSRQPPWTSSHKDG